MFLFTVDEARVFKKQYAEVKDLKKEYDKFSGIVNLFTIWFLILTGVRSLLVATIIVSLFSNQPDLTYAWSQGYGFIGLIIYIIASCIDLMKLLDLGIFIAVIIGAFTIGNGISANFLPFLVPIILCYAITFGLILASNLAINVIVKKVCPKTYSSIFMATKTNELLEGMF